MSARLSKLLTVEGLMTGEKMRGAVTSAVSGTTATALTILGVTVMGLSATTSATLFQFVLGSLLSYSLDILFAKARFGGATVPYTALGRRFRWLAGSLVHRPFFRFGITLIIETITGVALLKAAIRTMNRRRFMPNWKLRDAAAAVVVSVAVFLLFGNILRFDWAYSEADQPVLNIVVLMWMALALLAYSIKVDQAGDD